MVAAAVCFSWLIFLVGDEQNFYVPLLQVGADVCAKDDNGDTPLHCAAKLKPLKPDLIRFLLQVS